LSGIIACQIQEGQYDVAKEQLEFLKGNIVEKLSKNFLTYDFI